MNFPEEEFYCKIFFRPKDSRVTPHPDSACSRPSGPKEQVVGWACERAAGGRTFACTGPHYHASFRDDDFRRLALNAILWTAKIDVPQSGVQVQGRTGPWSRRRKTTHEERKMILASALCGPTPPRQPPCTSALEALLILAEDDDAVHGQQGIARPPDAIFDFTRPPVLEIEPESA